jgi:PAS domain S-box-containing protein
MLWLALGPVLLALSLCGNVWAGSVIGAWRIEAAAARILAENDAPAAYKEAEHLQAALPADATHADRARLLNLLSRIEIYLALTDRAATHAQQAFDLSKQHADRIGQAEADLNIALNAINQGRLDAMTAAVTDSMVILDGVDRPDLLSEAMLRTAMTYRRQGQLDDSITMTMQTMEIARRSNDPVALAYAHQGMAISFEQSGHLKEAREHYTQMREQAHAAHMQRLEAESIIGLGRLASRLGDVPGGERLTREAIDIYRKIGNPFSVAFGLFALAENLHGQDRTTASLPVLDEVVAIYEKYPNPIGLWWALNLRSKYYQSLDRADDARIDAERAYTLAKNIGFPLYLSESAKRLAAIVADHGDYHRAYQLFAEADKMSAQAAVESASAHMLALTKRYETESKQRQIDALKLRNERQTVELQKWVLQQRWLWTTLGGSIIILAGTAIFLLRLRRSHRQLESAHTQLQRFQSHQQAILDAIPDCLFEFGLDGRYYDCHALQHDLLAAPVDDILGKTVLDVMPQAAADICLFALHEAHEKGTSTGRQFSLLLPQGMYWFELSVARKSMALGEEPRFIVLSRDITRRKQYDILEKARLDMLDKLSEDAPLAEVLMPLVVCVEQLHPDFLSSIMLLDITGQHLYSIPVPSLSPDYLAAVDGILVGEGCGSCGTAAARGETVIVEDVRDHPYWVPYRDLAQQAGLVACWSEPILDSSGKVLGTFGIYRRVPGAPSALEMALVRQASHLAAIVIERRQLQDALAQREREFRTLAENSPDNIIRYDLQCRMRYVNPRLEKTLGKRAQELLGKTSNEAKSRPETDYDDYSMKIKTVLRTGQENEIELTLPDIGEGERYHHVRFVAEREVNGNIVGVLAMGRDITQKRRVERLLLNLSNSIPGLLGAYRTRPDGSSHQVYASPGIYDVFGVTFNEVKDDGTPRLERIHPDDLIASQTIMAEAVRTMAPAWNEYRVNHPVKGEIWLETHAIPVLEDDGSIIWYGYTAEVTERHQLQDALKEREREFRTLAENSPDNILRYDLQCKLRYINPIFEKTMNVREQDLLGKTPLESYPDGEYAEYQAKVEETISTGQDGQLELTLPDTGAGVRYHHVSFVAERGSNGDIVGALAMGRDITEYRRLQNALAQREQEFRTLAENSPEMIVRYDRDCRCIYINPACERQSGIPIENAWNKTPDEVWKPLMLPEEYMASLKHVMETGAPEHILLEWHVLDGGLVSHLMHAVAEYDEQENVVGVLVIGHNITELKETERQLEESQHLLRQLAASSEIAREDERKELAREMHDELGQYLMALRMNVTAVGLKFGENNPMLQEKTGQLTALVDSTIQVVRNVVVSLRPNVLDMGIVPALEWLVDEHQKRTETPCELQVGDEDIYLDDKQATAVFRIVQESLTNIGRHAKANKVDIVLEQSDGQFVLQVRDNGQGFDPAVRKDKSFGLVGMQERALMLGGELEITSAPGCGTVIKLCIPVSNVWSEE